MKSLILSFTLIAFAAAAHAGSDKKSADESSCCSMTTSTSQAKADCQAKGSCCSAKAAKTTACTKTVLKSPKAIG